MVTLRDLHRFQTERSLVQLEDGRVGKIVRVDTTFPGNKTVVSVFTVGRAGEVGQVLSDQDLLAEEAPPEEDPISAASASRNGPGITRVSLERVVGLARVSG